jgi:hypothetical protein
MVTVKQYSGPSGGIITWVLSLALVLLSSGWGPALSRMIAARPAWSVCGQTLCMCQPLPLAPECPLCPADKPVGTPCPAGSDNGPAEQLKRIDPTRIALIDAGPGVVIGQIGHATQTLLVGLFLLRAVPDAPAIRQPDRRLADFDRSAPRAPDRSVPTPPPRRV